MTSTQERIGSAEIARAVEIAAAAGNALLHISEDWSRVRRVVVMAGPLMPSVRDAITQAAPSLRYWSAPGTPHDVGTEGFLSERDAVAISFPQLDGQPRMR